MSAITEEQSLKDYFQLIIDISNEDIELELTKLGVLNPNHLFLDGAILEDLPLTIKDTNKLTTIWDEFFRKKVQELHVPFNLYYTSFTMEMVAEMAFLYDIKINPGLKSKIVSGLIAYMEMASYLESINGVYNIEVFRKDFIPKYTFIKKYQNEFQEEISSHQTKFIYSKMHTPTNELHRHLANYSTIDELEHQEFKKIVKRLELK